MATKLARHGTEAGYKQELRAKNGTCDRCVRAHREYNRQWTQAYKARGIKYNTEAVLDSVSVQGQRVLQRGAPVRPASPKSPALEASSGDPQSDREPTEAGAGSSGRGSIGAMLGNRLRAMGGQGQATPDAGYVPDPESIPEYLQESDPDPDPEGWEAVPPSDAEYVLNEEGMRKIEDNLGFYLSILGMTVEMVDPYCGPILAMNMHKMVKAWVKVIAHYPKAVEFFMNDSNGILMTWVGALTATWPLLYAIYEHHLSRKVRVHDGVVERKINDEFRPGTFTGDFATTPPMGDYNFTVG